MKVLYWRDVATTGAAFHLVEGELPRRATDRGYHGHDFSELFVVHQGRCRHTINGQTEYLQPGTLAFIRESDFHTLEPNGPEPLRITNLAFPTGTADFVQARYLAEKSRFYAAAGNQPELVELSPSVLGRLESALRELAAAPRERFFLERFLLNLLYELRDPVANALPAGTPDWLVDALKKVEQRALFAEGVPAFVRLCGRSHEHVTRVTRQFVGRTPSQLIRDLRLDHAARQLESSDEPIMEVAANVGLPNLSHFYTLFQKRFGVAPRQYRRQHRQVVC
ncbi:MAG: helix-turn-helix domain-containing protein [Opitutales bacterium]